MSRIVGIICSFGIILIVASSFLMTTYATYNKINKKLENSVNESIQYYSYIEELESGMEDSIEHVEEIEELIK